MARIVGVHGIWWHWKSRAEMEDTWRTSLRTGLENIRDPHAATATFEAAYYGHLYNAGSGKSDGGRAYTAADVEEGFELDLLEALAAAVIADDPAARPGDDAATKGLAIRGVQALLDVVQRSPFIGGMASSGVIRLLKQVHRYFDDAQLRSDVRAEVRAAIGSDTRVVVAHSLGTVAAYEELWDHPEWEIDTLVTMGSPLGLKGVMSRLDPKAGAKPGLPPSVRRWVNVSAEQDIVALRKRLKTLYGDAVEDFVVDNPLLQFHDSARYLTNVRTARAVAAALG